MEEEFKKLSKELEKIKYVNISDQDYWDAKELMSIFGYKNWEEFLKIINRSYKTIRKFGKVCDIYFKPIYKKVDSKRVIDNYNLGKVGLALTIMNCNSNNRNVAIAQCYIASKFDLMLFLEELYDIDYLIYNF